jgi:hypothetical protein
VCNFNRRIGGQEKFASDTLISCPPVLLFKIAGVSNNPYADPSGKAFV